MSGGHGVDKAFGLKRQNAGTIIVMTILLFVAIESEVRQPIVAAAVHVLPVVGIVGAFVRWMRRAQELQLHADRLVVKWEFKTEVFSYAEVLEVDVVEQGLRLQLTGARVRVVPVLGGVREAARAALDASRRRAPTPQVPGHDGRALPKTMELFGESFAEALGPTRSAWSERTVGDPVQPAASQRLGYALLVFFPAAFVLGLAAHQVPRDMHMLEAVAGVGSALLSVGAAWWGSRWPKRRSVCTYVADGGVVVATMVNGVVRERVYPFVDATEFSTGVRGWFRRREVTRFRTDWGAWLVLKAKPVADPGPGDPLHLVRAVAAQYQAFQADVA